MTTLDLMLFATAVLLLAGTIKGFIGLGLPTVSLALLTLGTDPRMAITLILMPMLLSNLWQMARGGPLGTLLRRYGRFALVLGLSVGLTAWFSRDAGDRLLMGALGAILLLYALLDSLRRVPPLPERHVGLIEVIWAALTGVIGGLTAGWGGPMAMYLSARHAPRDEFVQASGLLIAAGSLPLMIAYLAAGHADPRGLGLSAVLLVPTFAGFALGERLRHRADPALFRRALILLFVVLGANLIWRAMHGG